MSNATLENHGHIAVLRLTNGVTNAIGPEMLEDLAEAIEEIRQSYKGLVLAGGPKFFSIGFDLPRILLLNRDGMTAFFDRFNHISLELFTLSMPTACVIAGHAIAGGNILALTCDYRYAATEKKWIGLNEIKLGLPVPYLADLILRQIVGDRKASEMMYRGEFMSLADAFGAGLVDAHAPSSDPEDYVMAKIDELAALRQPAFASIKATRVESVCERYQRNCRVKSDTFLDCWFDPSTQKLLHEAAEKF